MKTDSSLSSLLMIIQYIPFSPGYLGVPRSWKSCKINVVRADTLGYSTWRCRICRDTALSDAKLRAVSKAAVSRLWLERSVDNRLVAATAGVVEWPPSWRPGHVTDDWRDFIRRWQASSSVCIGCLWSLWHCARLQWLTYAAVPAADVYQRKKTFVSERFTVTVFRVNVTCYMRPVHRQQSLHWAGAHVSVGIT